jgi:hypothetical protein
VLVVAGQAAKDTFGMIATFGGIGLLVNGLVIYIGALVLRERKENQQYSREP